MPDWFVNLRDDPEKRPDFYFPLQQEGESIVLTYLKSPDTLTCGILADWLEDHRDDLLVGATGPTDPAARLDALIAHLRSRFEGK